MGGTEKEVRGGSEVVEKGVVRSRGQGCSVEGKQVGRKGDRDGETETGE